MSLRLPRLSFSLFQKAAVLGVAGFLILTDPARATDPTIVSVVPANGATGVSPSAPLVLTFSEAMDTNATSVSFLDTNGNTLTTISTWSDGNTVLTCTPSPAFPSPDEIIWFASGADTSENQLQGQLAGFYTIGGSGGGGGGGGGGGACAVMHTNNAFVISESFLYDQTSAAAPTADPNTPYQVLAEAVLISNLTATAVTLTLPNESQTNVPNLPGDEQTFLLIGEETTLAGLNADWPSGLYVFDVTPTSGSFPPVSVNFDLTQPSAPEIVNFAATQAVNPAQPFTLTWMPFANRMGTNEIVVNVGYNPCVGTGFTTNLPGTATSTTIPANVLAAASNYVNSTIGFINASGTKGVNPEFSAGAVATSLTEFTLTTTTGSGGGGPPSPPSLGSPVCTAGVVSFTITAPPNTTVTVQIAPSPTGSWTTLQTINSGSGTITFTDTPAPAVVRFYRAFD